jgi:uncharacterized membrane protein YadS
MICSATATAAVTSTVAADVPATAIAAQTVAAMQLLRALLPFPLLHNRLSRNAQRNV